MSKRTVHKVEARHCHSLEGVEASPTEEIADLRDMHQKISLLALGVLSPEEEKEVREFIAGHQEARLLLEELTAPASAAEQAEADAFIKSLPWPTPVPTPPIVNDADWTGMLMNTERVKEVVRPGYGQTLKVNRKIGIVPPVTVAPHTGGMAAALTGERLPPKPTPKSRSEGKK
jgi:hypothetical protein